MAAFPILEHSYRQDEADGLLDRALAISTHAVYWKTKNDPFAGGNQSYERLAENGLETLAVDDSNVRGRFAITGATDNTLEVSGVSDRYEGIGVRVYVTGYDIMTSDVVFDGSITLGGDVEDDGAGG